LESVKLEGEYSILAIDGNFTDRYKKSTNFTYNNAHYLIQGVKSKVLTNCKIFTEIPDIPEVVYTINGFIVCQNEDEYLTVEGENAGSYYVNKLNFAEGDVANAKFIFFKELSNFHAIKEKNEAFFKDKVLTFLKAEITSDNIKLIYNDDIFIVSKMEVKGL
jgi:hypothetical protein